MTKNELLHLCDLALGRIAQMRFALEVLQEQGAQAEKELSVLKQQLDLENQKENA